MGSIMLIPLFVCATPTGRRKENAKRSLGFPTASILKAALSRLDVGPAYYEDPVSRTSSLSLLGPVVPMPPRFPVLFF